MAEYKIQQSETDPKGSFYIEENEVRVGEMTYSKAGEDRIIIDHTVVNETHKSLGLGEKMLRGAVDHAREKGLKIIPLCPFASAMFRRHEDLRDVL